MTRFIEGLLRTAERSLARGLSEGMTCAGGTPMRTGRPIPPLTLTEDERDTLERWPRRPTTAHALAERARLVLACAAGKTNTVVVRDRPFVWTKTADEILASLARFCHRISNSGH